MLKRRQIDILIIRFLLALSSKSCSFWIFTISFLGMSLIYRRIFHFDNSYIIIALITCPFFFYFYDKLNTKKNDKMDDVRNKLRKELEELKKNHSKK